jgi:tripeptide aminopeptidase
MKEFDPADAYLGPQRIFLAILGLVGLEGVSGPLLPRRK